MNMLADLGKLTKEDVELIHRTVKLERGARGRRLPGPVEIVAFLNREEAIEALEHWAETGATIFRGQRIKLLKKLGVTYEKPGPEEEYRKYQKEENLDRGQTHAPK